MTATRRPGEGSATNLLWTADQLVRLITGHCVAAALLGVAWYQASNALSVGPQLSWSNVGVLAIGISLGSNGLWLYRGHRAVSIARREVANGIAARRPASVASGEPESMGQLVSSPPMSRYHAPDCVFAKGRPVKVATRARHHEAGRRPCEVCLRNDVDGEAPVTSDATAEMARG